ncbi:MAG: hypothetical protein ABWY51_02170 [Gaiellaceae bacterium]
MKVAVAAAALGLGAAGITVTTLPKPPFPGPVVSAPDAKRLVVVSSRRISPGLGRDDSCRLTNVPGSLRGLPLQRAICPGGPDFAFYGRDGASSRILLSSKDYALDFKKYVWPPRNVPGEKEFVYEELVWAREATGVLYVQNAHLTYARSSYGQNAYVTALDATTKRRLWRSKALVANAQTFAVTPDYLLTGYGFTAEPDYLYLLDRHTGGVVERLSLPSGPEKITRRGKNFVVRTYDHVLVVRLRGP